MPTRRAVIAGTGAFATVALAGCAGVLTEGSVECDIVNILDGGVCEVEVTNNGYPGDLKVILETRDESGAVLGTTAEVVDVGIGETRIVNVNPELHSELDHLTVSVESA